MASSTDGSTGARPGTGTTEDAPTQALNAADRSAGADGKSSGSSASGSKGSGSRTTGSRGSGSQGSRSPGSGSQGTGSKGSATRGTGTSAAGAKTGASRTGTGTGTGSANRPTSSPSAAQKGASRSPAKSGSAAPATRSGGPRRIRLTLSRVDPFSVMKMSFLIAIAVGIATVVAVAVLWNLVEVIGIWDKIDSIGRDLNNDKPLPFMDYFKFSKMISYATIAAVVDIVIITALGTLLAFLYNIVAALLGGLKVTFTDE